MLRKLKKARHDGESRVVLTSGLVTNYAAARQGSRPCPAYWDPAKGRYAILTTDLIDADATRALWQDQPRAA